MRDDFCVDKLKRFPGQNSEKRYTECTGETIADIVGNFYGIPMDAGFAYGAGFAASGVTPSTIGEDPWSVIQGAVAFGSLPITAQDFDATTVGELYEANFANYSADDKKLALSYKMPAPKNIGVDFDAVLNYITTKGVGVSLGMKWSGGLDTYYALTLPWNGTATSSHCVAVYGQKTINSQAYLIVKPWTGSDWGDGGYCYMSRNVFNQTVSCAYSFDPNGNHWLACVSMLITRFPYLAKYAPQLLTSNAGDFPPNPIYVEAKSCLGKHITLDDTVDITVGCCQAVSYVLKKAGVPNIPAKGISGTDTFFYWLTANKSFKRLDAPQQGCIILSPTQGANTGHIGICGIYGILSNNSFGTDAGKFTENFSYESWDNYFGRKGLEIYYFLYIQ